MVHTSFGVQCIHVLFAQPGTHLRRKADRELDPIWIDRVALDQLLVSLVQFTSISLDTGYSQFPSTVFRE
ncbi:MAG: hypothetical protein V1853_01535 [bacterium]